MNRQGSATLLVMGVLTLLSLMFAGAVAFMGLSVRGLQRNKARMESLAGLRAQAQLVVEGLLADPTPFADSPFDPVWALLQTPRSDGVEVQLQDVSSRLGLNWIRKEVLASAQVLRPGHSAQELQQLREDQGLRVNLEPGFGELVQAEDLEALFTPYGWFNINIADEFVLRAVHRSRGKNAASAERFHGLVQAARVAQRVIGAGDLPTFLGEEDYPLLFPVVNAEPVMNLHFVPSKILRILFTYYELPASGETAILEARRSTEVTPGKLRELLGGDAEKTQLESYLGLRTWFWRITVGRAGQQQLSWIVARVPRADELPEFRLLEERVNP